jgi:hypothetical protein
MRRVKAVFDLYALPDSLFYPQLQSCRNTSWGGHSHWIASLGNVPPARNDGRIKSVKIRVNPRTKILKLLTGEVSPLRSGQLKTAPHFVLMRF